MTDTYLARSTRLAARKVDGEMVILSADDSSLYVLNEVATALWEAADGHTPLVTIIERVICTEYDIDAETVRRDALEFAEALAGHHILRVSNDPIVNEDDAA